LNVEKLKQRINSEWATLSHTVIERADVEWHAFVLEADTLSTYCKKYDVRNTERCAKALAYSD